MDPTWGKRMKPTPFAQYLARQQQAGPRAETPAAWPPKSRPGAAPAAARTSPLLRPNEKPEPQPKRDVALRQEEADLAAHRKAHEDGREAARAELEQERGRLRAEFDAKIAAARAAWAAEEGGRLMEAHRAAIDSFEARCAQAVAGILRPFLVQETIARVTEGLVETLEALFAARAPGLFEISGPPDLLDALKEKFEAGAARMEFRPDPSIDVRVRVEDTLIETQLGPWMKALGALPRGRGDE
jgi:hypothetical protein